jgi:hypothetical protein
MMGSVKMRRDYAKRLSATFNLEIPSEHFGNGRSLSIEGSTVEIHEILGDNVKKKTAPVSLTFFEQLVTRRCNNNRSHYSFD